MTEDTTIYEEENLFSAREVPWMKLGKLVEEPQTTEQAIQLAGLDFTVSKRPAGYMDEDGGTVWSSNRVATVRDDTGEAFEFVSSDYQVLQNREAFDFMDAVSPRFVAAGSLKGGRQVFMVVQPEGSMTTIAPGGDEIEMYGILRTAHDRSRAVEISFMGLRGACMNQLPLRSFTRGAKYRWSIPHVSTMDDKLLQAHATMAQLDRYTEAFNRLAERLMLAHPTEGEARKIVRDALWFGGKDQKRDEITSEIIGLWHNDEDRVGYNDTAWGLVNAVSEYVEWHRRGRKDNTEARFLAAVQGGTHRALNQVVDQTLALASA